MSVRACVAMLVVVGCRPAEVEPTGETCPPEITGPVTGATRRFVLDRMEVPLQKADFGDDLNGDGKSDNQLGNVIGTAQATATGVTPEMIAALVAAGGIAGTLEITSDDETLTEDPTVSVRWAAGTDVHAGGAVVLGSLVA